MISKYNKILLPIFYIIDIFVTILSFLLSHYIRFHHLPETGSQYFDILLFIVSSWALISFLFKIYREERGKSFQKKIKELITAKLVLLLVILAGLILTKTYFISRQVLILFILIDFFFSVLTKLIRHRSLIWYRKKGKNYKSILLVGSLPEKYDDKDLFPAGTGYNIQDHINAEGNKKEIIDSIETSLEEKEYDLLLITSSLELNHSIHSIIAMAENHGLRVSFYPEFINSFNQKLEIQYIGDVPLMYIRNEPLKYLHNRILKRGLDILIAGLGFICVFWWFYLLIGMIIKLTSKGPVLFKQKRVGINGEEFWCYKFRTMTQPEDPEQARNGAREITTEEDPRVTSIGRFLRKSNLDELPQIINILKGEMSVVGPRPHMLEEDLFLRKNVSRYMVRQFVKPGLTGWAAINGYRGGTKNLEAMKKRVDHDIYYIEFWSLFFDLKIIGITFWQMITFNVPNAY